MTLETAPTAADGQRQKEVPGCHLTHHTAPTADRWRSLAVTSHTRRSPQQTDGGPLLDRWRSLADRWRSLADRWRSLAVTSHTSHTRRPLPPPPPPPQQTDGGPLLSPHTPDAPPPPPHSRQMEVPCCHLTHQTAPTADRWRSLAVT